MRACPPDEFINRWPRALRPIALPAQPPPLADDCRWMLTTFGLPWEIQIHGYCDTTLSSDCRATPLAVVWNGEYESRALRERREREARERSRAASGEPEVPVQRTPCQAYRDCICGLSRINGAFGPGCAEADELLRRAPDDPEACNTGRLIQRQLAEELGLDVPLACHTP